MSERARDLVAEPGHIKLEWLVRLHWLAIVGESLAIVGVEAAGLMRLPLVPLGALVAFSALVNLVLQAWLRRRPAVPDGLLAAVMLLDTAVLTGLLHLSGGHFNPFSTLYIVNVAVAAVLLPPRWSWTQALFSVLAFGALFPMQEWAPFGVQDHEAMMGVHLYGMLVAVAIAAFVIVLIVQRVTGALRTRDEELARERRLAEGRARLASLGTLAAGAAHELATPLGAIAVAARELERSLARGADGALDDARLIRSQVDRCKAILQQMSARAGENAGEAIEPLRVDRWVEGALDGLPGGERVVVELSCPGARVRAPARALERALRVLLTNALQASPPATPVWLAAVREGARVDVRVRDAGAGMEPAVLARAGEPFFTTKEPGQGSGLGLYIARSLAEQLGGGLALASRPGQGTTATISLPEAAGAEGA